MRYSKQYHQCLVELWNWHKNFRGAGVRNTRNGVSIAQPAARRSQPSDQPASSEIIPVWLKQDGGDYFPLPGQAAPVDGRTYSCYSLSGTLLAVHCPLATPRLVPDSEYTVANFGYAQRFSAAQLSAGDQVSGSAPFSLPGNVPGGGSSSQSTNLYLIIAFESAGEVQECDTAEESSS